MLNKNISSTIKFIAVLQGVTTSAANVPRYTPQYCGMSLSMLLHLYYAKNPLHLP